MEKVRPWCGQPSDRGRLKNRTEPTVYGSGRPTTAVVVVVLVVTGKQTEADDCFVTRPRSSSRGRTSQMTLLVLLLLQVVLPVLTGAWHAVETAHATFVLCHGSGNVSEVDTDGRVVRVSQSDQFFHPCHLAVVDGQ